MSKMIMLGTACGLLSAGCAGGASDARPSAPPASAVRESLPAVRFAEPPVVVYFKTTPGSPPSYSVVRTRRPLPKKADRTLRGYTRINGLRAEPSKAGTVNGRRACYAAAFFEEDGKSEPPLFPHKGKQTVTIDYALGNTATSKAVEVTPASHTYKETDAVGQSMLKQLRCKGYERRGGF